MPPIVIALYMGRILPPVVPNPLGFMGLYWGTVILRVTKGPLRVDIGVPLAV